MTSKLFPVPRFKILTFNFPTNAIQACISQHLNEAERIGCLGLLPLFKIGKFEYKGCKKKKPPKTKTMVFVFLSPWFHTHPIIDKFKYFKALRHIFLMLMYICIDFHLIANEVYLVLRMNGENDIQWNWWLAGPGCIASEGLRTIKRDLNFKWQYIFCNLFLNLILYQEELSSY